MQTNKELSGRNLLSNVLFVSSLNFTFRSKFLSQKFWIESFGILINPTSKKSKQQFVSIFLFVLCCIQSFVSCYFLIRIQTRSSTIIAAFRMLWCFTISRVLWWNRKQIDTPLRWIFSGISPTTTVKITIIFTFDKGDLRQRCTLQRITSVTPRDARLKSRLAYRKSDKLQ